MPPIDQALKELFLEIADEYGFSIPDMEVMPDHVHLIIECSPSVDLKAVCEQMGRSPEWMPGILLRADGYETEFYKKD